MHAGLVSAVPPQPEPFDWAQLELQQVGRPRPPSFSNSGASADTATSTGVDVKRSSSAASLPAGTSPYRSPNRLVGFACDGDWQDVCWARMYEVDGAGVQVAAVEVPATRVYFIPGAYRSEPWQTFAGERRVAPGK